MEQITFQFTDISEEYVPKDLPNDIGFSVGDVYQLWNKRLKIFGGRCLRYPIVTFDPDIPMQFGISLAFRVFFNMAYLPHNIPKDQYLWWIGLIPIAHEFGHYHICPYSGRDIIRYICEIRRIRTKIEHDMVLYILNFFSDLMVNYNLYQEMADEYKKAMMVWFDWQNSISVTKNISHSHSWNFFVRIHELLWKEPVSMLSAQALDADMEKSCEKIAKYISSHKSDDDILRAIIQLLPFFEIDIAKDQDILTFEDFNTPSASSSKNPANAISINNKIIPIDMLMTCGNCFEQKLASNVADKDQETEKLEMIEEMLSITESESSGRGISGKGLKMLYEFILTDKMDALRYLLRYQTEKLFKYDIKENTFSAQFPSGITEWNYSDGIDKWNIPLSIATNPLCPIVPFAKKWKTSNGIIGDKSVKYKDILIAVDSSGSMCGISDRISKEPSSPFDFVLLSGFGLLHSAIKRNAEFNIVNFSSNVHISGWMRSSVRNTKIAELHLLNYQGSGTVFPLNTITDIAKKRPNILIVIITDMGITNPNDFLKLITLSKKSEIPIFLFHIGTENKAILQNKTESNFFYYPINALSDLIDISITLAHKYYID